MGTNYYAVRNRPSMEGPIHIGKSSMGWMFLFQRQNEQWHDPPVVWNTFNQVKDWLRKYCVDSDEYAIMNEYDEIVTYDDLMETIQWHQEDENCRSNPDNFHYSDNVDGYRFTSGDFS